MIIHILLCCVVLCCAVLCCVVLCCVVLCCVVLCCVVLCCVVLCCVVLSVCCNIGVILFSVMTNGCNITPKIGCNIVLCDDKRAPYRMETKNKICG
jgi:hypothetical protein